jgi:hypothetical protein
MLQTLLSYLLLLLAIFSEMAGFTNFASATLLFVIAMNVMDINYKLTKRQ